MPIATPTLAVTDNADGSGGIATITGGDLGATNEVSVQAVNGELGSATWTLAGSRIGNGTVNLPVAPGYYWVKVKASAGGESVTGNLVYASFTDGEKAVLHRCLVATQARIQGLHLSGIANDRIERTLLSQFVDEVRHLPIQATRNMAKRLLVERFRRQGLKDDLKEAVRESVSDLLRENKIDIGTTRE